MGGGTLDESRIGELGGCSVVATQQGVWRLSSRQKEARKLSYSAVELITSDLEAV